MSISTAQRTFLSHILDQKELDPEVVSAVEHILAGKIQATPDDVRSLIDTLCKAQDREDLGWKAAGIVH